MRCVFAWVFCKVGKETRELLPGTVGSSIQSSVPISRDEDVGCLERLRGLTSRDGGGLRLVADQGTQSGDYRVTGGGGTLGGRSKSPWPPPSETGPRVNVLMIQRHYVDVKRGIILFLSGLRKSREPVSFPEIR